MFPTSGFRRGIGEHKGKRFSVTGEALDENAYDRHVQEVLPTAEDRRTLRAIAREPDWIAVN